MEEKDDWRLAGQEKYLRGSVLSTGGIANTKRILTGITTIALFVGLSSVWPDALVPEATARFRPRLKQIAAYLSASCFLRRSLRLNYYILSHLRRNFMGEF
jgi:hypothetical protein